MRSRARFAGHAIHPVLIVFPLGLLVTALVFDILFLITESRSFAVSAAYTTAAGVLGGLAAILFGWIDWFAVPKHTRAKKVGLVHGLVNVLMVALFAVSWLVRLDRTTWDPTSLSITLATAAIILALIGGWLGGELVERLSLSVDEEANVDASSSLKRVVTKPANDTR
ncbi:DUF2231 domain-containing protein [Actinophytocola sp. NPDC049390]|uniref:DUF2231 domain-containing protein n=1 Tax=Actinophytocola sp. NPDC049390 TaxID=3363894 RepID=UPI00378F2B8A